MSEYKAGVHTAELTLDKGGWIEFESVPNEYRAAIESIARGKYKLKIPLLPGLEEYNDAITTQEAISKAIEVYTDTNNKRGRITRIDYRLDDYERSYAEEFAVMRALTIVMAYKHGMQNRLFQLQNPVTGEPLSIRYMPEENANATAPMYGMEYYNKPAQIGTSQYGNARLELRAMNIDGKSVREVMNDWKKDFESIKRRDYLNAMQECASYLYRRKKDSDQMRLFVRSVASDLIGKEEETYLYRLEGKKLHKAGLCHHPTYSEVRSRIKEVAAALR